MGWMFVSNDLLKRRCANCFLPGLAVGTSLPLVSNTAFFTALGDILKCGMQ